MRRAAAAAQKSSCYPIVAVIGANADVSRRELIGLDIEEAYNPYWETGMGSSIHAGMRRLCEVDSSVGGVVLLVCDQPYVTEEIIIRLINLHWTGHNPIVASSYAGSFGVPALFGKEIFPELLQLERGEGAKSIIKKHYSRAGFVLFPEGEVDLDTSADYEKVVLEGAE